MSRIALQFRRTEEQLLEHWTTPVRYIPAAIVRNGAEGDKVTLDRNLAREKSDFALFRLPMPGHSVEFEAGEGLVRLCDFRREAVIGATRLNE